MRMQAAPWIESIVLYQITGGQNNETEDLQGFKREGYNNSRQPQLRFKRDGSEVHGQRTQRGSASVEFKTRLLSHDRL